MSLHLPAQPPGVIFVLGSPNDEKGRLYSIAVERCRCALRIHRNNPSWPLLLTGGFGAHFNTTQLPHAEYLRRWLIDHGVSEPSFLPHAESKNTLEDAALAKPIVLATGAAVAAVVTSDYHAERARFVFEKEFSDTGIVLVIVATETNERDCELDLRELIRHERDALARLRAPSVPSRT